MFCSNCGKQIPDNSAFCLNCGTAFSQPQQPQYPPQYQPQPGGYMPPQKPAEEPGKGLAIASLVLGIVSFLCFAYISGPLAIIFGCVANSKGYRGKMATAGIVCGAVAVVLWIFGLILLLFADYSIANTFGYY